MTRDSLAWTDTLLEVWRSGQRLSAIGPGPVDEHLTHSLAIAAQLDPPAVGVDLGSGAGVPGLALAGIWPESRWTLVDAARRRCQLLEDAVSALGWVDRVTVVHGRAEDLGRDEAYREGATLVTARSFGPPAVTAECGAPLVAVGGLLVVTEPPEAGDRWPDEPLAALGMVTEPSPAGDAVRIQRLRKTAPIDRRFPRRPGIPAKRPLF